MANEPTRPLGGTTMNGVIIKKQTTVEGALSGNNVLMVGRILNKRQMSELLATASKKEIEVIEEETTSTVVEPVAANTNEKTVEIPEFFLRYQEEIEIAKARQQRRANKKKAPIKKPSLLKNIVNTLVSL